MSRSMDILGRRLRDGATSVEVLVLRGPDAGTGTRWVLDEEGAALHGEPPEALRDALAREACELGPARRHGRVELEAEGERWELYLERWSPAPRLVLFGGGHIGRAICSALRDLEFRVHLVEDRAYFADPNRFEGRVRCVQVPLSEGAERLEVDAEDYVVIATRGHNEDLSCLRSALGRRPFYLGLLGSRRKLREFLRVLEEEGADPEQLARVRCPVGLDIGAETPEEIAVAVAAELVAVRSGRGA